MPAYDETLIPLDAPLSPLAQALVVGCLALAQQLGQPVPAITDPAALNGDRRARPHPRDARAPVSSTDTCTLRRRLNVTQAGVATPSPDPVVRPLISMSARIAV